MITKVKVEFKKDNPSLMVIIDESTYEHPIKYLKLFITIPGYTEAKTVTINPNKVTSIDSEFFNLYSFPDGLYKIVVDAPDCVLDFEVLNTSGLDKCLDDSILELAECSTNNENIKKINEALVLRTAAKRLDCNAKKYYQLARKLVCQDCN